MCVVLNLIKLHTPCDYDGVRIGGVSITDIEHTDNSAVMSNSYSTLHTVLQRIQYETEVVGMLMKASETKVMLAGFEPTKGARRIDHRTSLTLSAVFSVV